MRVLWRAALYAYARICEDRAARALARSMGPRTLSHAQRVRLAARRARLHAKAEKLFHKLELKA